MSDIALAGSKSETAAQSYVLAADGLDDIVWRSSEELGNDRELVHVVFSGEQWLALQHLCKDAACAPDIHLHVVLLPCKHDFGGSVVPRGDIARHLRILYARQTKIANLQIAVLIDKNVARLQVTVNNAGGVYIFQSALLESVANSWNSGWLGTHQNLVEEVLNELLLEGPRSEQAVKIGSEEFGDKVASGVRKWSG